MYVSYFEMTGCFWNIYKMFQFSKKKCWRSFLLPSSHVDDIGWQSVTTQ